MSHAVIGVFATPSVACVLQHGHMRPSELSILIADDFSTMRRVIRNMLCELGYAQAKQAVRECDVLFSICTSAVVYPAAVLPFEAAERGATVIQINPVKTDLDAVANFNLRGSAGRIMADLVATAWPGNE